jgi:spermidine synthase
MAQVEQYPDARRLFERPSPVGWLVAVQARAFRFAPGLSLGYRGAFPDQHALFVDGELAGARSAWAGDAADLLDWVPAALPYVTGARRRVLVLGNAAGLEVAAALAHGAERVTAVELHPELVRAGQPLGLDAGRVRWVVGDARAHLARTTARHDLIALGPAGGHGAGAGGLHALNEDFLHTVEAYGGFLDRLTDDGVLAITRWLELPPRSAVRVVLMVAEALRRRGVDVSRALVVVRSWNTATILAKPGGFSEAELAALAAWSDARWFDVDWRPGLRAVPVPRFHMTDDPVLFRAARAASGSRAWADEFAAAYLFRVAPATDARPYPHQFVGFDAWRSFARRERGEWLAFAELGYVALVATLAQSAILAALLIVLPVALRARRAPEDGPIAARHRVRLVGYFTAIGLAYLATEIAAIQQLTLLLGHPVYAVTASLAVMLGCSGAGSAWSDRWEQASPRLVCWVTAALLALLAAGLLPLVHAAQGAPLAARAALAAVALAPAALVMGTPFPLGLRALAARDQDRIAIAWAANGYASAVAAPLAALIAIELGSPALFAAAGLGYAVAALLSSRVTRGVGPA